MTDAELLSAYVEKTSHEAFTSLVGRHARWVHSAARRRVGDEHLAQDVTQAVFLLLAQRARGIRNPERVGAWLMRATHYAANHAVREQSRRRVREQRAARMRPEGVVRNADGESSAVYVALDEAVARLRSGDRELIVRRFYEGESLDAIAAGLGVSADTARKRVSRALVKLRGRLRRIHPSIEIEGLLASVSALGHAGAGVSKQVIAATALDASAASARAVAIGKGAMQMIVQAKIRVASLLIVALFAVGATVVWAVDGASPVSTTATAPAASSIRERTIMSSSIIITISADGKKLAGFSKETGKWSVVEGSGFDPANVIVGQDVGTYSSPTAVYGFGRMTGVWGKADIPAELRSVKAPEPVVSSRVAAFSIPGAIYGFSGETGTWDSVRFPSSTQAQISVSTDWADSESGGRYYVFGVKTGKWVTPF